MSAIGEYIHYTVYGYAKYGTNLPRQGETSLKGDQAKVDFFNSYRRSVRKRAEKNNLLSNAEKNEIENVLSTFIEASISENQQFWNWAKEKLGADFDETLPFIFAQGLDVKTKIRRVSDKTGYSTASMVERRIKEIQLAIEEISSSNRADKELQIERLTIAKNKIMQSVVEVVEKARKVVKDSNYEAQTLQEKFKKALDTKRSFTDAEGRQAILDAINLASDTVQGLSNIKKGFLFESAAVYALAKALGIGYESIDDLMKKFQKGNNKSSVSIDISNFKHPEMIEKILNDSNYKKSEINPNVYLSITQSQNKIDIALDFHKKDLLASLKNINLWNKYDVSLVEEAEFLQFIQNLNSQFVNHYLNIIVSHGNSTYKTGKSNWINSSVRQAARLAMNAEIVYAALTGVKLGNEKANVFIVNNNKAGKNGKKIFIFNIADLLRNILLNLDYAANITPDLGKIWIPNNWKGDKIRDIEQGIARTGEVLAWLHSQKITVKIDKTQFQAMALSS